jgi:5-dehydro-4-deoxyglucarate dehydratase
MKPNYNDIKNALSNGLLSFPVTDMDVEGNFNGDTYRKRLEWFLSHQIAAIFVAGGTGEFFSLSKEEYVKIVKITTATINGKVPMISSVGRSIPEAIEFAKIAEDAGIDALLLMPPYLTECAKSGVFEYAKTIMQNTALPVIYYNRANGILPTEYIQKLVECCPNFIALKDGTGNIEALNSTIKTIGDRLTYIGGVPTAEILSEAYLSIGVNTYSSAVFNFVPEMAIKYYEALRAGDKKMVSLIIKEFFVPFVKLRNHSQGYAVSLIKEGAKLVGKSAGNVRAPLPIPNQNEVDELQQLIEKAKSIIR